MMFAQSIRLICRHCEVEIVLYSGCQCVNASMPLVSGVPAFAGLHLYWDNSVQPAGKRNVRVAQVSEEDIDAAFREYRGSEEEAADLLRLYSSHGGRMSEVRAAL